MKYPFNRICRSGFAEGGKMLRAVNRVSIAATLAATCAWLVFAGSVARAQTGSGPIEYDTYAGVATITVIEKTEASKAQNEHCVKYEGYDVRFTFQSDEPPKTELAKLAFQREWRVMLIKYSTEYYPGAKYLKKYNLKTGNHYPCTFKVETRGTATPVLYELKGLDCGDDFESDDTRSLADVKPI